MSKVTATSTRRSVASNKNLKAPPASAAVLAARHLDLMRKLERLEAEQSDGSRRKREAAWRNALVENDRAELLRTEILTAPVRSMADVLAVAVHGSLRAASIASGDNASDEMEQAVGITDCALARVAVFVARETGTALKDITREAGYLRNSAAEERR